MAVRHLFTIEEWHHMGETGLFGEDARVELLDGEVIEMAPIGSRHAGCVSTWLAPSSWRQGTVSWLPCKTR